MKIVCEKCGYVNTVHGLGRKRLANTVTKVCDALQDSSSVLAAAVKLGSSRAYIYKVAKTEKKVAELVAAKERRKPGRKPGRKSR